VKSENSINYRIEIHADAIHVTFWHTHTAFWNWADKILVMSLVLQYHLDISGCSQKLPKFQKCRPIWKVVTSSCFSSTLQF